MKGFVFLSVLTMFCAGCTKPNQPKVGCEPKFCTLEAVSIRVNFISTNYNIFTVKDVTATNLRTGIKLEVNPAPARPNEPDNSYIIAHDDMKEQFSEEGDDVLVTGTHSITNQTKSAVINIASGCNCHVSKRKTDPSTIIFD